MAESPIADVLAAGMLGVAAFCAGRLVLAVAWRRSNERDVDAVHVVMGVSMAGMLTGWLTGTWNDAWMVAFTVSTIWFGYAVVRQLSQHSPTATGCVHLPHFVASAAMLYMIFAMGSDTMGAAMRAMPSGGHSQMLDVAVAVLLVGDALLAAGWALLGVASPPERAVVAQASAPIGDGPGAELAYAGSGFAKTGGNRAGPLAPRATPACLVVMSLAMAYMFLTVRP
jgi:Domain of unknown function (DUF5134)